MGISYQYWQHKATGETYAVRLEGGHVTGLRELLPAPRLDTQALPHYDYDDIPDRCRRLEECGGEFLLAGQYW